MRGFVSDRTMTIIAANEILDQSIGGAVDKRVFMGAHGWRDVQWPEPRAMFITPTQ